MIVPETDFDGSMVPFRTDNSSLTKGKIAGSATSRGSAVQAYDNVVSSSIENFKSYKTMCHNIKLHEY